MRHWRWYSKLSFALLVAGFAYFVWPTPWQYRNIYNVPGRIHRVTGEVQLLWCDHESGLGFYWAEKEIAPDVRETLGRMHRVSQLPPSATPREARKRAELTLLLGYMLDGQASASEEQRATILEEELGLRSDPFAVSLIPGRPRTTDRP